MRPAKRGVQKTRQRRSRPVREAQIQPDLTSWLTRREAAEALGVSENTIINWQRKRRLVPTFVVQADRGGAERTQWLYDPKELAKIPRSNRFAPRIRSEGELAARCFELLNEGWTIRDIVIDLREHPDKIETLKEKWLDYGGADSVITDEAQKEFEDLVGPFKSVAELLVLVRGLVEQATRDRERAIKK